MAGKQRKAASLLKQHKRTQRKTSASIARGGRSHVAMGDDSGSGRLTLTASGTASNGVTFSPQESGILDELIVDVEGDEPVTVKDITINGDSLISGGVAAALFAPGNPHRPKFGHPFNRTDNIVVTFEEHLGNTPVVSYGFSVL